MILLIDNYDSFVHNLARYFQRLGQPTLVLRNDAADPAAIERLGPAAIVLSPGPCTPAEAGCSLDVVRQFAGRLPMLGVCLGHQVIGAALGGRMLLANTGLVVFGVIFLGEELYETGVILLALRAGQRGVWA